MGMLSSADFALFRALHCFSSKWPFHLRVTGHFCLCEGGSPNQRPWSLSRDGFMLVEFRQGARFHRISPWLVSDSSPRQRYLECTPSGNRMHHFVLVFRTIWGRAGPLCWGRWSEQAGERGSTDFALVLVVSWKAPEPHVAEPIPVRLIWLWRVWRMLGLRLKLFLVFSCVIGLWGLLELLFFGWDFLYLWLRVLVLCLWTRVALPTVGSSPAVMVRSCYDLYGWYFPDVLWDRQVLFVFVMGWRTSSTAVGSDTRSV